MTKELGVRAARDCALVLIDYQKETFEVIRSETNADLAELHVRLPARPAREVINWYFNEVAELTDEVGVAEAEKLAAASRKGQ